MYEQYTRGEELFVLHILSVVFMPVNNTGFLLLSINLILLMINMRLVSLPSDNWDYYLAFVFSKMFFALVNDSNFWI